MGREKGVVGDPLSPRCDTCSYFPVTGDPATDIHITLNNYNNPIWKKVYSSFKFYITYQETVKKIPKVIQNSLNAKVRCTSMAEQRPISFQKYAKAIYLYNFSQYFVKIFPSTSIN